MSLDISQYLRHNYAFFIQCLVLLSFTLMVHVNGGVVKPIETQSTVLKNNQNRTEGVLLHVANVLNLMLNDSQTLLKRNDSDEMGKNESTVLSTEQLNKVKPLILRPVQVKEDLNVPLITTKLLTNNSVLKQPKTISIGGENDQIIKSNHLNSLKPIRINDIDAITSHKSVDNVLQLTANQPNQANITEPVKAINVMDMYQNSLTTLNNTIVNNGSRKRAKFISDNSTNAQQLNLPDVAEVWSLAGMKTVPAVVDNNAEGNSSTMINYLQGIAGNNSLQMPTNSSNSKEKTLLDWSQIMMMMNSSNTDVKRGAFFSDYSNTEDNSISVNNTELIVSTDLETTEKTLLNKLSVALGPMTTISPTDKIQAFGTMNQTIAPISTEIYPYNDMTTVTTTTAATLEATTQRTPTTTAPAENIKPPFSSTMTTTGELGIAKDKTDKAKNDMSTITLNQDSERYIVNNESAPHLAMEINMKTREKTETNIENISPFLMGTLQNETSKREQNNTDMRDLNVSMLNTTLSTMVTGEKNNENNDVVFIKHEQQSQSNNIASENELKNSHNDNLMRVSTTEQTLNVISTLETIAVNVSALENGESVNNKTIILLNSTKLPNLEEFTAITTVNPINTPENKLSDDLFSTATTITNKFETSTTTEKIVPETTVSSWSTENAIFRLATTTKPNDLEVDVTPTTVAFVEFSTGTTPVPITVKESAFEQKSVEKLPSASSNSEFFTNTTTQPTTTTTTITITTTTASTTISSIPFVTTDATNLEPTQHSFVPTSISETSIETNVIDNLDNLKTFPAVEKNGQENIVHNTTKSIATAIKTTEISNSTEELNETHTTDKVPLIINTQESVEINVHNHHSKEEEFENEDNVKEFNELITPAPTITTKMSSLITPTILNTTSAIAAAETNSTTQEPPLISLLDDSTTTTAYKINTTPTYTPTPTTSVSVAIETKVEQIYSVVSTTTQQTSTINSEPEIVKSTPHTRLQFNSPKTTSTTMRSSSTYLYPGNGDTESSSNNIGIDMMPTNIPGLMVPNIRTTSTDSQGTDVNIIIAITVSTIGVIALIFLVTFLYLIRKRQKQTSYGQRCRPVSLDAYSLDNVSVLGSVRRKGAMRASKRSYGNAAFDDPSLRHNILNVNELGRFVQDRSQIFEEFRDVPQIISRADEVPIGCENKNRYANVIPLPETRVSLLRLNDDEKSEYINANYVRGPKDKANYYIACQAPLEITVCDFWRMIWEQKSRVIIQATDLIENGIEKCAEYIPPSVTLDNHSTYGDFQVTLKNREVKDKYAISILMLKNISENVSRELTHYWYKWPEVGVPNEEAPIIAMLLEARSSLKSYAMDEANDIKEQKSENVAITMKNESEADKELSSNSNGNAVNSDLKLSSKTQGPLTVHCSPGTGRTGTIMACDMAIRSLETPKRSVDIPQLVYFVRRGRASAVQTKEQYEFIYKVTNMYATKITNLSNEN